MKKNNPVLPSNVFRQGDVLLTPISALPKGLKPIEANRPVTLALGEVTGHHHSFTEGGVVGYADPDAKPESNGTILASHIEVKQALAGLTHQEHDTLQIPEGLYRITRQVEFDGQEMQRVAD